MDPEIIIFPKTALVGISLEMTMAKDLTHKLWSTFMPVAHPLRKGDSLELFSVQDFGDLIFFKQYDPNLPFTKYAMIRPGDLEQIPEDFESLIIPEGKYAKFTYRGKPSDAGPFFQAIYGNWLPKSGYKLENRPHLAIMGKKYLGEDPDSEEDIYIPVTIQK